MSQNSGQNPARDPVQAIAQAVLYEGYLLYPYRPSATKNRVRWTIGGIHPRDSGEPWQLQVQCLVVGSAPTVVVELRYLQLTVRQEWEDAVERQVLCRAGEQQLEAEGPITADTLVVLEPLGEDLHRLTARVSNTTPLTADPPRKAWLPHTMASAHLVLRVSGGQFVSQTDPPEPLRAAAEECRQIGSWPVLVGSEESRDTMLAAPIILEDFPRIAPESPGDLFDGTEIDEILTLRILTLTDAEKEEIRRTDDRARLLLERTEAMTPEQLMSLHGLMK